MLNGRSGHNFYYVLWNKKQEGSSSLVSFLLDLSHFDQPLPSWQPLYNEDEEKAEEMEFFTIPAIIKRRTKYLVQNLNFFIQVQAATKVPSAITKTWRLNDMTAVSVPQHQARVVRYEIFIWTILFHLSMQGLGLYYPSQPHVHPSEPGRKLLSHW